MIQKDRLIVEKNSNVSLVGLYLMPVNASDNIEAVLQSKRRGR